MKEYTKALLLAATAIAVLPADAKDYIAEIGPRQALPWRMVLVTTDDTQLLNTDTPYCLAPECRLNDTSWIRPGKVAWDWWNNWNLSQVEFRAGINTPTYKYYLDFAHDNGLEYIIVDEGWSSEVLRVSFCLSVRTKQIINAGKLRRLRRGHLLFATA